MKNKSKGFTIVELVIVIAVVAVLAAVLVPTFSEIISKANLSTDTQLVRNMNVILSAEGVTAPPADVWEAAARLEENGTYKFKPKSRFYTFYWLKRENVIILADEDDHPVFPEGYSELEYDAGNWFDLKSAADLPEAPTEEFDPVGEVAQTFTVTLRKSGTATNINFNIEPTATEGKRYQATLKIPEELQVTHRFRKITVLMEDGDTEHEFVIREQWESGSDRQAHISIPAVTGNITVNVSIIEFCKVTFTGDGVKGGQYSVHCEKGMLLHFDTNRLEKYIFINDSYMLTGATGVMNGRDVGDIYDENNRVIDSPSSLQITGDLDITVTTAPKAYTVKLRIMNRSTGDDKTEIITVSNPQDPHKIKLAELLGTYKFKVTYKSLTTNATHKDLIPTCGYNESSKELVIHNFKSDCSITCIVELTE